MNTVDRAIKTIDKAVCGNIATLGINERGLLAQNILSQFRNFAELISLKAFSNGNDIEVSYANIQSAVSFVKIRADLKFLSRFHKLLQITTSHYTLDEENSERLMLKYYEYLLKSKLYLKAAHNLDVLSNLSDFPLNTDFTMREYHEKIVAQIKQLERTGAKYTFSDRYYIQKIKPFFVGNEVFYEVTFTTANDKTSKFDRIIAFTKYDISPNYAVKLWVSNDSIEVLGKEMPIHIIDNWEVSIRPCELNNFARIFGSNRKSASGSVEYLELMKYLTSSGLNLVEIIDFPDGYYQSFKQLITGRTKVSNFIGILDKCREITKNNLPGSVLIRYLLHRLNNKIIKKQYSSTECERLSNLYLDYGCIPFDQMPFNTSLLNHNPRLSDLFDCIDFNDRKHELFARLINNNTERSGQLYTPVRKIEKFEDIDGLIWRYNNALYYKHGYRVLEIYKDHVYIRGYEDDTRFIIAELKYLAESGIDNYTNSVNAWLGSSSHYIDCDEKKNAIRSVFNDSRVALIYGSAGTGKSTLINHISHFFKDKHKIYLAKTKPAVDNLNRKVDAPNCIFKTITKFLYGRDNECDLLFIDECSTVSNSDMRQILTKAKLKLLVLVGDVFQIESILFGNWFHIARHVVPKSAIFELTKPYRTNNSQLLELWKRVRNIDDNILEHLTKNNYSFILNESIFERSEKDEIILCLNYDGLYGINNINRFLQSSNPHIPVQWGIHTYKIDDPVLFNEAERFVPLIYNNMKGRIVNMKIRNDKIQFDIEIDKVLNELDTSGYDFRIVGNADNGNSVISFYVNKYSSSDDDDDDADAIVPFQIAYAVSIHKAQGLEYDSVKVVITNEIEEMISHNIFYTAITRTKEKLKIYWTPETEKKVLDGLENKFKNKKDISLLKTKFRL